ncbi:aminopeptidase N-like [Nylanderia fulva]|uniref:aminopeptidase N-like n=1 Tax=Nylanderia fulva TaxID=613905 RepID=UPI0010FB8237|nr:aminopeptidase N-like [Nylanderia fulva]
MDLDPKNTDDLSNIMQTVMDKLRHKIIPGTIMVNPDFRVYKLKLNQMMDIWSIQMFCPVINVIRNYSSGIAKISKEFYELNQQPYFIPVTYTSETNLEFNKTLPNVTECLTQSTSELEIPNLNENEWIIANIQQSGYYRVNYDSENWRKIARYLNSENYTNIHVINRAQIIDDAFHFAMQGKLSFSIFWDLTSYLPRKETNYVAWYPMIKIFYNIMQILPFSYAPRNLPYTALKEILFQIKSLFEEMKLYKDDQSLLFFEERDEQQNYLNLILSKLGCIIQDFLCLKMAEVQLELHLINKKIIMPGWYEWTYCNGLRRANDTLWGQAWKEATNKYLAKSDYTMFEYLTCIEHPQILLHYLKSALPKFEKDLFLNSENNETLQVIQNQQRKIKTKIFFSTLATHAKNNNMLKEILSNFNDIKFSHINSTAAFIVLINNAYFKDQIDQIFKYAKINMPQLFSYIANKTVKRSTQIEEQLTFFVNLIEKANQKWYGKVNSNSSIA